MIDWTGLVTDKGSVRASVGRVAFWIAFAALLPLLVLHGDTQTLLYLVFGLLAYATGTKALTKAPIPLDTGVRMEATAEAEDQP